MRLESRSLYLDGKSYSLESTAEQTERQAMIIKGKYTSKRVYVLNEKTGKWKELLPGKSQKLYNYSPDGFDWGYTGNGLAQLALAIMLEAFDKDDNAVWDYQAFKRNFLCELPPKNFQININIKQWHKNTIQ